MDERHEHQYETPAIALIGSLRDLTLGDKDHPAADSIISGIPNDFSGGIT